MQDKREKLIQLATQCAKSLKDKYKVKKVFLIGSLVNGFFHDRSDIDLVVMGLPSELYIKALTELYHILPKGVEIDLIPYESAFKSVREEALKEGKLLYG